MYLVLEQNFSAFVFSLSEIQPKLADLNGASKVSAIFSATLNQYYDVFYVFFTFCFLNLRLSISLFIFDK